MSEQRSPAPSPSLASHFSLPRVELAHSTAGTWTSFRALMAWQLTQIGATVLPLVVIVQALLAAGIILGFGLLIPQMDDATARFLSTGAPTVLLTTIGLAIVPQGVARARADGSFAYLRTLPAPRGLLLVVDLVVWATISMPAIVVCVLVARLRYGLSFSFDWPLLVGAAVLVTVTAIAVGYAIAVSLPPLIAQLTSQVLVFFVLLFSPITYPASQLPTWFASFHGYLPVQPAADLLRAGLAANVYSAGGQDLAVLLVWCIAGVVLSLRALVRRR